MKKITLVVVVIILVVGGVIVGLMVRSSPKQEVIEVTPTPIVVLPTIPEGITVDLIPRADKKAVVLKIKGLTVDVESIEYELTYTTGAGLPRGVLGKIALKGGERQITRDDIVLGTCSSGKCVYDTGVTSVDLSLKFNTSEGAFVFQKIYSL